MSSSVGMMTFPIYGKLKIELSGWWFHLVISHGAANGSGIEWGYEGDMMTGWWLTYPLKNDGVHQIGSSSQRHWGSHKII